MAAWTPCDVWRRGCLSFRNPKSAIRNPPMWQSILGHDDVVEQFRRSLASGRLASTYLFLGPEGIGKRSLAVRLAKALMCKHGPEQELAPCGRCESCLLLDAGNHPDLDIVGLPAGKRQLPVETFIGDRDHRNQEGLCHNLALRPQLGRRRVAIIDDADYFTTESANCLLKTLEEPPHGVVIFLIGTNRSRQLPTILSRSQVVRFQPLPLDAVTRLLAEQGLADSPQQAERLAAESGGSLHSATVLASVNLAEFRQRFRNLFASGFRDGPRLADVVHDFVNAAREEGTEAELRRQRLRLVFGVAVERLRQDLTAVPNEMLRQDTVLAALDRTLQAEEELDRNANLATLVECWIDDLAQILATEAATA
jgi:DNA polymerase III subunit delta'